MIYNGHSGLRGFGLPSKLLTTFNPFSRSSWEEKGVQINELDVDGGGDEEDEQQLLVGLLSHGTRRESRHVNGHSNGHVNGNGLAHPSASAQPQRPLSRLRTLLTPQGLRIMGDEISSTVWRVRAYLATVLVLTLSYFALLAYALWHHALGHTRDPNHPLANMTLEAWARGDDRAPSSAPRPSNTNATTTARGRRSSLLGFLPSPRIVRAGSLRAPIMARKARLRASFVDQLIVPLFSAVMTCQASSVRNAPVAEVLEYVATTFLRSHYRVEGGVCIVQQRLVQRLTRERIHTDAQVVEIIREEEVRKGHVFKQPPMPGAGAETGGRGTFALLVKKGNTGQLEVFEGFHHCIFATQANQTAEFVTRTFGSQQQPSKQGAVASASHSKMQEMAARLTQFKYEHSSVINHTDQSMMPVFKSDWRDLNLISPICDLNKVPSPALGALDSDSDEGQEQEDDADATPKAGAVKPHRGANGNGNGHANNSHLWTSLPSPTGSSSSISHQGDANGDDVSTWA